jgi:hypothetical protein
LRKYFINIIKIKAAVELDEIEDEHYKDATTIMQLLRDNLTNWSGEI